jgi:hypothetical protein
MQPILNADCTMGKKKIEHWKKLHDDEFRDLYISFNILGMIKARRVFWP